MESESLIEVVERVKATYREDADAKIASALAEKQRAHDERDRVISRVNAHATKGARFLSHSAFYIVGLLVVAGVAALLPNAFNYLSPRGELLGWVAVTIVAVLTVFNLVSGVHVHQLRVKLEQWLEKRLSQWLLEQD